MKNLNRVASFILLAVALFVAGVSNADDLTLVVWRPGPGMPEVLLPRRSNETPQQAVQAYIDHLYNDTALRLLIPNNINLRNYSTSDARDFKRRSSKALLSGFTANQIADLVNEDHHRMGEAIASFSQGPTEIEPYVLALAGAHRFTAEMQDQYEWKIADLLEYFVGLGGEDWAPNMYGENVQHAVGFNPIMDYEEIELRKKIIIRGKAFRVLICRSFQIEMVILLGLTLIQDLEKEGFSPERAHRGPPEARVIRHPLMMNPKSRAASVYLADFFEKNGKRLNSDGMILTESNSWHHQAADYLAGVRMPALLGLDKAFVVALGPHGILEMVEGPNFFGNQGHIELPIPGRGTEFGDAIIAGTKKDALAHRDNWNRKYSVRDSGLIVGINDRPARSELIKPGFMCTSALGAEPHLIMPGQ